jgi:hypothetical protein
MVNSVDKFIAFVDVLGFKKMVAESEEGTGLPLSDLMQLLKHLGTGVERAHFERSGPTCCPQAPRIQKNLDFRVTQISDCVVVSAEISPAGVINLIHHCWGAVIELMTRGIMCRGYIKRGRVFHSDSQIIGSGYQDAYSAERNVRAFMREADERGTPYVEVDAEVYQYVESQPDACVKEMFGRMVKRDGEVVVLFPFQMLRHSFLIGSIGGRFDPEKEHTSNQNLRNKLLRMKERVWSFVDRSNPNAVSKANHYIAALDTQLRVCDETDEEIRMLASPIRNLSNDF